MKKINTTPVNNWTRTVLAYFSQGNHKWGISRTSDKKSLTLKMRAKDPLGNFFPIGFFWCKHSLEKHNT